ncbi:flavin monoamine oxidase family protein [Psychrobacter immobilis]|uniref:flavin monoamine oxidase family protein n=1 Tax=Psychrobacter immobilis TaxID=498 RepID=UPI001919B18C|nr:FAD-dependent oxidoreductase [Psychrobacter immobilis]
MQTVSVAIIGGGLSGLYAAYLLEKKGVDYVLLEARPTLGGRIVTARATDPNTAQITDSTSGFDLGPSWFWPEYQQQLARLIDELQLESFAQFEEGDMLVERSPNEPAMRTHGYKSAPPSMRLKGGMATLIDALYQRLDATRILTNQKVRQLHNTGHYIEITSEDESGQVAVYQTQQWQAQHVLLALPPRLAEESITFEPALPTNLMTQWRGTATWMAPHAKYLAVYDNPFWQQQGLSGSARSGQGPMVEIHDASVVDGNGALFGFIGVPAAARQTVSADVLKQHCREQLVRLFGAQAESPQAEYLKDWAQEPFTATSADANSDGQHATAPISKALSGIWANSLSGIGSEWSAQFPGYLAGAIDAASIGVKNLPESIAQSVQNKSATL